MPEWTAQWAEGITAQNRDVYVNFDRMLTFMLQIARDQALPKHINFSESGMDVITPEQFQTAQLINKKAGVGEDIRPINPTSSPRERDELLRYFTGALQRGGLSFVTHGQLEIEISGVTLERLLSATRTILQPYIECVQFALSEMFMQLLGQYKAMGSPKISLETRMKTQGPSSGFFIENFAREDIPKTTWVEVELNLALPQNLLARIQAARQLFGDNRAIIDEQTVFEEILGDIVPDIEVVQRRMRDDEARHDPMVMAAGTIASFRRIAVERRERGETDVADLLERLAVAMEQRIVASIGQNAPQSNQKALNPPEPRPEHLSAEASGAAPEEMNIAFGRTPPRPVQSTTEQRLRGMGLVPGR